MTGAPQALHLAILLQRAAAADRVAFAEIYRLTAPQLFGLATRMLKRRDIAEDVVQEVFITIWNKAASFDATRGNAAAWMASILRNRCLDRLRARQPETSIEAFPQSADWTDPLPGPLDRALASNEAQALSRCLDLLESGPRNAILRVYFEGLTHVELAARGTVPLGTVKSWIRRGLMRLKDCLAE